MSAPPPAFQVLDRLLTGELPVGEFERWVYASPEIETQLGSGDYFQLLAFDYRQPHAIHELRRLVGAVYERRRPGMLARDRAWRLACGLASGSLPVAAAHGLAILHYGGHGWVPLDFVGISVELDDVPSPGQRPLGDPQALAGAEAEWQPYLDELRAVAAQVARDFLRAEFPDAPCA